MISSPPLRILTACALMSACVGVDAADPAFDELDEFGQTTSAVTCDPRMTIFPVAAEHNIGYDRASCGTGTCVISCPDRNANSDWNRTTHQGIDVFAFRGAPMVAVADGTVVRVGTPSSTSGLRVRLRDDCGWEYYYGHMDSVSVREGQRVSAGDLLGTMGNTGTSGVHLHFNISPDGEYSNDINPFPLLQSTSGTACAPAPPPPPPPPPAEPPMATRNEGAARPTLAPIGGPSRFTFAGPERVFDTRAPADSLRLIRSDGSTGPLTGTISGTVSDWPGLPGGATGVWLNLAALRSTTPGFIVAYPNGPPPETSTLNFLDGEVRANSAIVPLGEAGAAKFDATSQVDVIADSFGAFGATGLGLESVPPARIADSRDTDGPIPAGTDFVVNVSAPPGATGVVASVAVISGGTPGFITAYPCGAPRPDTSNINYGASGVRANTIVSGIAGGEVCFWTLEPVEIIVDVTGYLMPTGGLSYQALAPTRLLDTREDDSLYVGRLAAEQIVELPIQSLAGAPAGIQSAVVNLTTVGASGPGHLTAFPCGFARPDTSNLNHREADVLGVLALSQVGAGNLCVFSRERTHLVVDLLGVWVPTADPGTPDAGVPDAGVADASMPDADTPDGGAGSDGGADGGGEADGGGLDGGPRPSVDDGCACRASGAGRGGHTRLLALFGVLAFIRRRRRA